MPIELHPLVADNIPVFPSRAIDNASMANTSFEVIEKLAFHLLYKSIINN